MYGLILEGVFFYVKKVFGTEILDKITSKANIQCSSFNPYQVSITSYLGRDALIRRPGFQSVEYVCSQIKNIFTFRKRIFKAILEIIVERAPN